MLEATVADAPSYALGADVEVIRRRDSILLFASSTKRSVRISAVAAELLPMLAEGADLPQLLARLQQSHPRSTDTATKLDAFLSMLERNGMIRGASGPVRRMRGKYPMFSPDPIARALAWPLLQLPSAARGVLALTMVILAIATIAVLALEGGIPPLRDMAEYLHWGGIVLFALVVVPIHELAHAIACRLVGIRVGDAGIVLHGGVVPGPYVDTSDSYSLRSRWQRFVIPAAGPFVNLVSAGTIAAVLLTAPPSVQPLLQGALLACLLFVYFDTNPLTPSDGSHCLEAWLDDELARRHALSLRAHPHADRRVVTLYRLATVLHLLLGAFFLWLWWQ